MNKESEKISEKILKGALSFLDSLYNDTKKKYLEETKDLKHLVRFMFYKYVQSKDCDEIASEIIYQRCKEFGIFDDGGDVNVKK